MFWEKGLFGLTLSILLWSCSNDFDVTADYKEFTVVYGILDQGDSVQYIKIGKSYLGDTTSALVIAQESDSLYQNDIAAYLEEIDNAGNILNTYVLSLVDGNNEPDLPLKPEGIFANSPNYLYKLSQSLNPESTYKLNIENPSSEELITAETQLIDGIKINFPKENLEVSWVGPKVRIRWISSKNALQYSLIIRIKYQEVINGNTTNKHIDWLAMSGVKSQSPNGSESLEFEIETNSLFNYISNNVPNTTVDARIIGTHDYFLTAGGTELVNYINVEEAQSGITEGQIKPIYTNINNGLGIFSTRYTEELHDIQYTSRTVDSLVNGSITGHLFTN